MHAREFYFQKKLFLLHITLMVFFAVNNAKTAFGQEYIFNSAHNNSFQNASQLEVNGKLTYVFGLLGHGEEVVDYYTFTLSKYTDQVRFELFTPKSASETEFYPSLVFIDPRFAILDGLVPVGFPRTVGGQVMSWDKNLNTEVILGRSFSRGQLLLKDLPPSTYYIALFDPQALGGRYVLRFGTDAKTFHWWVGILDLIAGLRIRYDFY